MQKQNSHQCIMIAIIVIMKLVTIFMSLLQWFVIYCLVLIPV